MQIVKPYAKMLGNDKGYFTEDDGIQMLQRIEYYARVSHRSEEAQTDDSWDRFLRAVVLSHGDWSVVEHEKVTCEFLVDRGITHEIVRHRIGSYTQESTRFVNYQKKGGEAKFIEPSLEMFDGNAQAAVDWKAAMETSEAFYMTLCKDGIKPQIARSVLPNALASKIIVTYNLRSWRHFFIMRTSAEAHPQMREVVDPLLEDFKRTIPIFFEDLVAGGRQAEVMRNAR